MFQVRIHGRGGQGAVTAAELLSVPAFRQGRYAQAFPSFGYNAITKLGPGKGFAIDLDYCKGCGLCAAECPCGAIEMTPEQ